MDLKGQIKKRFNFIIMFGYFKDNKLLLLKQDKYKVIIDKLLVFRIK
jgi:hypothetical protein